MLVMVVTPELPPCTGWQHENRYTSQCLLFEFSKMASYQKTKTTVELLKRIYIYIYVTQGFTLSSSPFQEICSNDYTIYPPQKLIARIWKLMSGKMILSFWKKGSCKGRLVCFRGVECWNSTFCIMLWSILFKWQEGSHCQTKFLRWLV